METTEVVEQVFRWTDHPHARSCPGCGEDARTSAIVSLAYVFESCSCDRVDYAHLVERLWHIKCLRELAEVERLRAAIDKFLSTGRRESHFCHNCGRQTSQSSEPHRCREIITMLERDLRAALSTEAAQ